MINLASVNSDCGQIDRAMRWLMGHLVGIRSQAADDSHLSMLSLEANYCFWETDKTGNGYPINA